MPNSRLILVAIALLLSAPAWAQVQPIRAKSPVRIVSWNIEWLGTPDSRRHQGKGVAQKPAALANVLLRAKPDIIVLQEVRADGSIDEDPDLESPQIAAMLDALEQRMGGTWDHVMFPVHSGSGAQLTGLAWNTDRVRTVGRWRQIHRDLGPDAPEGARPRTAGPRPPHGMKFTCGDGLTDFVVVPIHWKSSWNGDFREQRAREAAEITAGLRVCFDDPDVIVIGDANCSSADEPAIKTMAEAGFVDLNRRDAPTHVGGRPLDRAFVPADQPEFQRARFKVLPPRHREAFKRDLSDHYPIVLTFQADEDDD